MVLNLAVARSDPVRAFVRPAFSSCKCSVCVSIQYKYVTTSVSKKRTFASTEKLRGKNESTLRAWQTKRRQQFGGKSGTNMTGFDRIRCNPVQARGAKQSKMAALSRVSPSLISCGRMRPGADPEWASHD